TGPSQAQTRMKPSLTTCEPTIFFFQAEDGIRDKLVTGVQTCALPICGNRKGWIENFVFKERSRHFRQSQAPAQTSLSRNDIRSRSEERRVGKECRDRRAT